MRQETESGFTIIEVVFAMAILAIGLFGLGIMQAHFAEGNTQSRQMIHATDIATNQIEELANADPTDAALDTDVTHNETNTEHPMNYNLTWDVTNNMDQTYTIDLTVSWSTAGRDHEVNVSWIKAL